MKTFLEKIFEDFLGASSAFSASCLQPITSIPVRALDPLGHFYLWKSILVYSHFSFCLSSSMNLSHLSKYWYLLNIVLDWIPPDLVFKTRILEKAFIWEIILENSIWKVGKLEWVRKEANTECINIARDKWGSNLLGAFWRMRTTEFCRVIIPKRQEYWGINPLIHDHNWLKTAPSHIYSTVLIFPCRH